jgi:hypothetical protein
MSPDEIREIIFPAMAQQQTVTVMYQHKTDGRITMHKVVPYSVDAGKRSKSKKEMF